MQTNEQQTNDFQTNEDNLIVTKVLESTGDSVDDLITNTNRFNLLAGNFNFYNKDTQQIDKEAFLIQLKSQSKVILEEAKETFKAIHEDNDPEAALDGCVDVLVTAFGLAGMLGLAGFDVDGACNTTAANNLTKFTADEGVVEKTLLAETSYVAQEFDLPVINEDTDEVETLKAFVFKDQEGKVRKPVGYIKNDLKAFVPAEFKSGF